MSVSTDGIEIVSGRRTRRTSRIVLADRDDAILLFLSLGRDHTQEPRWITPGGGVDDGEGFATAAVRELREETGLVIEHPGEAFAAVDFLVDARWHPYEVGRWTWFAVRTDRFTPSDAGWTEDERAEVLEHRWWSLEDLEREAPLFEPEDLLLLARRGLRELRDRGE